MGDQDRGQTGDSLEAVRESTGDRNQAGLTELSVEAGMAEMRELCLRLLPLWEGVSDTQVDPGDDAGRRSLVGDAHGAPGAELGQSLPTDMRPDSCCRIGSAHPRRAVERMYRWPAMAGAAMAVTGRHHVSRFEQVCATPAFPTHGRDWAVAGLSHSGPPRRPVAVAGSGAALARDTARGGCQIAASVFSTAVAALRATASWARTAVAVGHRRRTDG